MTQDNNDELTIKAHSDLKKIITSLESYYIDNQSYPPTLEDLIHPIPYIEKIPADVYSQDSPYQYKKVNQGYVVWSVVKNGVTKLNDRDDIDDIDDDIIYKYP
jgi:hypothetical protein